jgi:polysaccharide pyruvyl transferase WcaK-like protein/MoaA/NifB/PqqE/SkfB family radical SAM enzyme
VGVSGGEPTLRNDLDQMFEVFVSSVKNLKGIGLITNAINTNQVLSSIEKVDKVCKQAGVPFNVMVSLDGIGAVHDSVRGREGNFQSALHVLRHLRDETDIPLLIGCTIIKENVWNVDEVLQFCRDENINGRFRVAEFIERLYNQDLTGQIRNFDDDERYQIALFFSKLLYSYETSPIIKETYKNIIGMISEDQPRSSGCPYRHTAICMDCAGNLFYCSPKSPKIGSCLEKSAYDIYKENLHIRQEIIAQQCSSCIHDYHDEPSDLMKQQDAVRQEWISKLSIVSSLEMAKTVELPAAVAEQTLKRILIIGWYGTETAGDKAILDEILLCFRDRYPNVQMTVASLYPFVTKRTLKELGREDIAIIETYSATYLETCRSSDAVIMGGGPLMGMEPLGFVLAAFAEAAKSGVPTVIEGCGIGPIAEEVHIETLKEIIRLSSVIRVRDTESLAWIERHTARRDAICAGDPAAGYVKRYMNNDIAVHQKQQTLACFLREITTEYMAGMTIEDFLDFRSKFEEELGKLVRYICVTTGLKPVLMPMHTFVIGNDDRDFARRFAGEHLTGLEYTIGNRIYSAQDILSTMLDSDLCLCMRFHSVLFTDVLGVPYIPVDYTGGGKIMGFLKDKDKLDEYLDRKTVAAGLWREQVDKVLAGYEKKVPDHQSDRELMFLQLIHEGKKALRNCETDRRDLVRQLETQLKASEAEQTERLEVIHKLEEQLTAMKTSLSWKITSPLRWIYKKASKKE